ncbi:MAG: cupin domain-containing protein [Bacteroidales bacterium]|nr:cupin domain-containing protein [Bacteroidales bacterium]
MLDINTSEIFGLKNSVEYASGAIVSKTIIKKSSGNITLFAFDESQELSEHTAPFDAVVYVMDGKAEIAIDKKPFILNQGETIIMPANIPHAVKAVEKFKMMLVMIKS